MAEDKNYINLSIKELQEYIEKEYADVIAAYPIGMGERRAGIFLTTLEDGSLYLDTINIRPAAQGQGKGKEILNVLKNWADTNKVAVYIKPAYLPDNPTFKGIETTPEKQVENLFNYYKNNGWEDNPNFTSLSSSEQSAQLSLSANAEWGANTDDLYSPLVYTPEGVDVPNLSKNPYINDIISSAEKFNIDGKAFVDGYNQPILDETIQGILKIEPYYGLSGYGLEVDEWKKSKFSKISDILVEQGIDPSDIEDISKYIPRDKILTPAQIFKGGRRNEYFTDEIIEMLSTDVGSFYEIDDAGDELSPKNKPKRNHRLYYIISQGDEVGGELYKDYIQDISGPYNRNPEPTKWVDYLVKGERNVDIPDTPTNVVDEGIELYHSRAKGFDKPSDFHAGTYRSASDRAALMFGDVNMYDLIFDMKTDFESLVTDELKSITWDAESESWYTERYITGEVSLPNGFVDDYDIRIDVFDEGSVEVVLGKNGEQIGYVFTDSNASFVDAEDLNDGDTLYDFIDKEKLNEVIQNKDVDALFGEAGGFLEPGRKFNYKDGYDLYKVNINSDAKIITFTDNVEIIENGKPASIDPDIFVNFVERENLKTLDEFTLPDGTKVELKNLSNSEKVKKIKENIDVIGYKNQMEDVGSTSYYFLNDNVYTETKVDNATNIKFNDEVLEKYVTTQPYTVDLDNDFKGANPDRINKAKTFTDTPTNVVDDVSKLQDNINNYLNETILENPSRIPDLAVDPLTLSLSDDGKSINIIELVIDENYRNQGLGREVFNRIKEFANNNNLSITTTPLVGELEDLVKKEGFVKEGNQYILKQNTPTNVVGNEFVDNIVNANTQLVNDLPLSETVKKQFDNVVRNRAKNLTTPGGVVDAVDVWEMGVLGLMITAIAYKEFDEIPTIFKRTATNMFNSMTAPYNIPPVPLEQYDLDYEFIEKVITTGEKVMPTDIIIKKVGEIAKGVGEQGLATGFGYVPTTPKNTDTMETTEKIQPGVQEEKMFKEAKPKKIKSTGGSGAKIL